MRIERPSHAGKLVSKWYAGTWCAEEPTASAERNWAEPSQQAHVTVGRVSQHRVSLLGTPLRLLSRTAMRPARGGPAIRVIGFPTPGYQWVGAGRGHLS